ncbi:MAG: LysM peptidoglycan-binding domain-containing protein [Steroidobacteraceae bacterium]|jgi:membrane-bound lytic murein transglycosylase D|nr:LysM peptidoglycan-binding domain-containing protein [Steroidobacteraceae bacterium]
MLSTPAARHYVKIRRRPAAGTAALCTLVLLAASVEAQVVAPQGTGRTVTSAPAAPPMGVPPPPAPVALATPATSAIPRPPELQRDVDFWIRIYSEVTTAEGLLHDEWDLSVVYAKLQFPADTEPGARRDAVDAARERYVAALKNAAAAIAARTAGAPADAASLGEDERRVLSAWGVAATPERLLEAARGVRFQLGQADRFKAGLIRSGAWETHIAEAFANLGLPPELAALPHVESSFTPSAYSKVGAAGLWQFMRSTGRRYMRVDDVVDERLDPFRSTEAAAQLLAYNYRVLGTWPLALTAYNHGAAGMRRAKEAMGTDDFVTIARRYRGPTFGFASRNFYPSFLAALSIDQDPEKYFGAIERAPEIRFREVAMPGYARVAVVERAVDVPRATLRELNPALRGPIWDGSRYVPRGYRLRLPPGPGELTPEWLTARIGANELYAAQVQSRSHRVRKGETLASIARRYGLSQRELADLNGLATGARVRRGRTLRLPDTRPPLLAASEARPAAGSAVAPASAPAVAAVAAATTAAAVSAAVAQGDTAAAEAAAAGGATASPGRSYVVRAGDTLFGVAARFGLTARELMALNGIRDADFIFEGQRLRVAADPAALAAATAVAEAPAGPDDGEVETPSPAAGARPAPPSAAAPVVAAAAAAAKNASEEAALSTSSSAASRTRRASGATAPGVTPATAPAPATGRAGTASAAPASARNEPAPRASEPVTAEALGPEIGPGAGMPPPLADAIDLAVRDGSVRVIAEETLGHYADWLGVSAARLRELNRMKYGQAVLLGRTLKLDFSRTTPDEFEQKRRDFHARLQAAFFAQRRILGTEVYIVRRGDTLWSITQRYAGVPVWLLQQYNPDLELGALRTGAQLVVPRLEDAQTGVVAGR